MKKVKFQPETFDYVIACFLRNTIHSQKSGSKSDSNRKCFKRLSPSFKYVGSS